ncbi:MAG TPA: DUF5696 domain-containing protein [Limnochordia bacterium]|nr:DUF5696 domain-containing protein [Limnochordia bacterium]
MRRFSLWLLLILFSLLCLDAELAAYGQELPNGYVVVAENEYLQLYLNESTTEIAVANRASGRVWYSNPNNTKAQEQLLIEYFTPRDDARTMNNRADSVAYGQFDITPLENGVKIVYVLGEEWTTEDYLPVFISEERFNELILSKIENEKERNFVRSNFVRFSLERIPEGYQRVAVSNLDKDALFGPYTIMTETNLAGRQKGDFIRHVLNSIVAWRNDAGSLSQLKPEMVVYFIDNPTYVRKPNLLPWDLEDMAKILKAAGYTPYDKQVDNAEYGLEPPERKVENFTIPVEYRLEGASLVARVPMEEVKYPKDVYTSDVWGLRGVHWTVSQDEMLMNAFGGIGGGGLVTFPLHAINLLPYFGAPSQAESGYILIPDGSGALINLSADRVRQTEDLTLQHRLYGENLSNLSTATDIQSEMELRRHFQPQQLPVFGMKCGDGAFLAVIEEGDAVASIVVKTAGRVNPVDTVYARFNVMPVGAVQLAVSSRGGGGANINTYQQRLVSSDLQVRYMFLEGEDADYVGMARLYQQYLIGRHGWKRVDPEPGIPLYLELIGAVHLQQPILGIPREVVRPMTTFAQAEAILDELINLGVQNIKLRYTGWLSGGVEHIYPNRVQVEKALGGKAGLLDLIASLNSKGVALYPDITQTLAARDRLGDGFSVHSDAAYSLNKYYVQRQLTTGTNAWVVSPGSLAAQVDGFLKDYEKYQIGALSLRDLGAALNSDFQEKEHLLIDREQAKQITIAQIEKLSRNLSLMMNSPNVYALVHADHILNMPLGSSGFVICDQEVPFYQLVVRGYVNYAGAALNYAVDYRDALLKALEIGASPYFIWSYEDSSLLKDTPFQYLLSINYRSWIDVAAAYYKELNNVLAPLQGQTLIGHRQLADRVFETTYEDGTKIIVNYNTEPVQVGDLIIDAKGYLVTGGE